MNRWGLGAAKAIRRCCPACGHMLAGMDQVKADFLFPGAPDRADLDNPEGRVHALRMQEAQGDGEDDEDYQSRLLAWSIIGEQVAKGEPPEVWAAAQRLSGAGVSHRLAMGQLSLALATPLEATLGDGDDFDGDAYREALAALPLPSPGRVKDKLIELCRSRQPVDFDDLVEAALPELGIPVGVAAFEGYVEAVVEDALEEDQLTYLNDDSLVEPGSYCAGAVLTHRLTEAEKDGGYISLGADLVELAPHASVLGPGGEQLEDVALDAGGFGWEGPDGWLAPYPAGTVLAARLAPESVEITVLDEAPPLRPEAVRAVENAYHSEKIAIEADLPVQVEDLFIDLMANEREVFAQPQAPLSELLDAAGLHVRGDEVAKEEGQWVNMEKAKRLFRVLDQLDDKELAARALEFIEVFNDGEWPESSPLRQGLALMGERPHVAAVVGHELLGGPDGQVEEGPAPAPRAAAFARRLLQVAHNPVETSVARWLAAMAAERAGEVAEAQAHLHAAVSAGSGWPLAVDRLAWYLSDRGDATGALALWRSLGYGPEDREVHGLERYTKGPSAKVGRNEPCWCGSGRKYKQCHLGQRELVPLPARVPWLLDKAVNFLTHNRERSGLDIARVALARRPDNASETVAETILEDPLVIDVVLTECGWWQRFVAERGPLLPDDEALLATAWTLVERTVYEVLSTRPGQSVTVRDLRTGDEIEVAERTFSHDARPGELVCGRAVPDGQGHQFVGGMFGVRAGQEAQLLDLLDEGEPEAIAAWAAALDAPPKMATREREPMVICTAVLQAQHPSAARVALSRLYELSEENDSTWHEMFALNADERIVRATLRLEGDRLTVETMSEERMERALAALKKAMPEGKLLSDDRQPFDFTKGPPPPPSGVPPSATGPGPELPPEVIEQVQEQLERRWCDEAVPALAGLTPRQAAADPSRRESLERLLAEFERFEAHDVPGGFVGMRAAHLRQLLGLA